MAGGPLRPYVTCALLAVAAAALISSPAGGYTGTPEGKRLARKALEYYTHVSFVSGTFTGDVMYCPQYHEGFIYWVPGPPGFPSCRTRATVTQVEVLSRGRAQVRVGQVTAPGKPTLTFVSRRDGYHVFDPTRGCWRNNDAGLRRGSVFYFENNERMTIAGRRGAYTILKGRVPHKFTETNRVDRRTGEIRSLRTVMAGKPRVVVNSSFSTVQAGPVVPDISPGCS